MLFHFGTGYACIAQVISVDVRLGQDMTG